MLRLGVSLARVALSVGAGRRVPGEAERSRLQRVLAGGNSTSAAPALAAGWQGMGGLECSGLRRILAGRQPSQGGRGWATKSTPGFGGFQQGGSTARPALTLGLKAIEGRWPGTL